MSGLLAGKVWLSNLDRKLKPLAATLADIANDDGTRIYPSVAYVAWRLGASERSVRAGLKGLIALGVLEIVVSGGHGPRCTTEYRLIEGKLPERPAWRDGRKGADPAPLTSRKGAKDSTKRVQSATHKGADFDRKSNSILNETSVDPLEEPPEKTAAAESPGDDRHRSFLQFAIEAFDAKYGQRPTWEPKDRHRLTQLLSHHPSLTLDELCRRWRNFLASTNFYVDSFRGSLTFFCNSFDRFVTGPLFAWSTGGRNGNSGTGALRPDQGRSTKAAPTRIDNALAS